MRTPRAGYRVGFRWKPTGGDAAEHGVAFGAATGKLSGSDRHRLRSLIRKVKGVNRSSASELCLGPELIERVFQSIVLVAALVAGSDTPHGHCSVRQLCKFVGLDNHTSVRKIDWQRHSVAESPSFACSD